MIVKAGLICSELPCAECSVDQPSEYLHTPTVCVILSDSILGLVQYPTNSLLKGSAATAIHVKSISLQFRNLCPKFEPTRPSGQC